MSLIDLWSALTGGYLHEHSRICWRQRVNIMSDEVELQALRDKVEEQGKVLLQLKEDAAKDAADAEERQKLSHEQLVG